MSNRIADFEPTGKLQAPAMTHRWWALKSSETNVTSTQRSDVRNCTAESRNSAKGDGPAPGEFGQL